MRMGLDLRPSCAKCSKVMGVDEMRAVDTSTFICKDCYDGSTTSSVKTGAFSRKAVSPSLRSQQERFAHPGTVVDPIEQSADAFFAEKHYICNACSFEFKRAATKQVNNCPYCGKDAIQQKVEQPVDEFIQ